MLLYPFAWLYQAVSWLRAFFASPYRASKPVICIGNLVAGGAGKTPVALFLAQYLKKKGQTPHIISRGYGSKVKLPVQVNAHSHQYRDVGDEPLLLSHVAPTWVCAHRKISMEKALDKGASLLIMDDGFQNPSYEKDLSLLVVDGTQGFGNGQVMPAGPLRESIGRGVSRADAIILIGEDLHNITNVVGQFKKPLIKAELTPLEVKPREVIAFAGLGYPQKFFKFLKKQGYKVQEEITFPDHHPYTNAELEALLLKAKRKNLPLITTEKDLLRIPKKYHAQIEVLKIQVNVLNIDILDRLMDRVL